ncbi:MAG TPA: hypothetical protein VFR85_00405 [Anaeromyxobacteraceae bacterium]|nr:hypothetical protein [Anaeromyxobacteraceae bacterium]
MANLGELIDRGIKAFTRGLRAEAERCWREALEIDPGNERVRGYLRQLQPARDPPGDGPGQVAPGAPASSAPAPRAAPPEASTPTGARSGSPPAQEFAPSPWDDGPALQATIVLEPEDGLDLSAISEKSGLWPLVPEPATTPAPRPAAPRSDVDVWMEGARELFALGDFSGSLEMIEKILKIDPGHAEAHAYLVQNESTLVSMYESKLGSLANVPRLAIKPEEVMWLNLDHRAGFLLAQIDGSVNFEELFALSGLPRLDTAKILAQLLADGVIRGGAQ